MPENSTTEDETALAVLALPIASNDADTIGEFLIALLRALWSEREGFSGKRPFGESGWDSELYIALIHAGMVTGTMNGGYLMTVDEREADRLILAAIQALLPAQDSGPSSVS